MKSNQMEILFLRTSNELLHAIAYERTKQVDDNRKEIDN